MITKYELINDAIKKLLSLKSNDLSSYRINLKLNQSTSSTINYNQLKRVNLI